MTRKSDKRCVFCGRTAAAGTPITREHVLPKWLSSQAAVRFIQGREAWRRDGKLIEPVRAVQPFTRRPWIACHDCNTGWMHRLEDRAMPLLKPMLDGQPTVLDFGQQAIIASWITKTCFAMQFARHDVDTSIPDRHLRELAAAGGDAAPEGVNVFVGNVVEQGLDDDGRFHFLAYSARQNVLYENDTPRDDLAAYVITLRIHRFVCQTQGLLQPSPDAPSEWGHLFDGRHIKRIWPREESSLSWPPALSVDQHPGGFALLASRPEAWES